MNNLIQNEGFHHVAEAIFQNLGERDLISCLRVSKSWFSFLTYGSFWKDRWVRRLDWVIDCRFDSVRKWDDRHTYRSEPRWIPPDPQPLFEAEPGWKDICEYMKNEESFATFRFFVTRMRQLSDMPGQCPLQSVLHLADLPEIWNFEDFLRLILRSPVAHKIDFSYALILSAVSSNFAQKNIEILFEYFDKVNIDVNWRHGLIGETPLHMIAEDYDCEGNERYLKIMLDNAEKCGLDVHATDTDGYNAFEYMCFFTPDTPEKEKRWSFRNKLDCWLDFPEFFESPGLFEVQCNRKKLINLVVELYNEKLEKGQDIGELNKKLKLPEDSSEPLTFHALRILVAPKKKDLVKIVWELYQKRIEDHQRNKGSKKAKMSSSDQ